MNDILFAKIKNIEQFLGETFRDFQPVTRAKEGSADKELNSTPLDEFAAQIAGAVTTAVEGVDFSALTKGIVGPVVKIVTVTK